MTDSGNRFILVISDDLTKWPEAFALKDHKAETTAIKLVDDVICRHGVPSRVVHTNYGRDFESNHIKQVCELLEIEKNEDNGIPPRVGWIVERLNKTLIGMVHSCVDENQKNWDALLSKILLGYRSNVQATTGYSPFSLVYGREAMLPVDVVFGGSKERFETKHEFVSRQKDYMELAFEKVREHTKTKQQRQKYYYDRKVHPGNQKLIYTVGDWVRVHVPHTKKGQVKKLQRSYRGPFRVVKVISEAVYRVQKVDGRKRMVVHYNRLKDANQERKAMTDTPTDGVPNLVTDKVTDAEPEEVSATDNQSANLENITEQTKGLVIPSRMAQTNNPEATPVVAVEDLVGDALPNLDAEQETIFNNDLVGVRE